MPSPVRSAMATVARAVADGEALLDAEGAVTVAQEDAHRVRFGIGGDDIGPAVAVQVGDGHGGRRQPDRHRVHRCEAAVAVAKMDGHRVLIDVGGDDVEVAVAGQIAAAAA